jgi:rubrerythrin
MIYLPRRLRDYIHEKAQAQGLEDGEYIYFVIRKYSESSGFKCNHPGGSLVLHVRAAGSKAALWRCRDCGYLFYKDKNGENHAKIEDVL